MPKRKAKQHTTNSSKKQKVSSDNSEDEESEQNNLQRTNTIEIIEIEKDSLQTLSRKRSSLSSSLFGDQKDILETEELSQTAKEKLESTLSAILQPNNLPTEILVQTCNIVDEESREFRNIIDSSPEEEEEGITFGDIPPELLVQIFLELGDEDKWRLAKVCKKLFAIFKLHVGWSHLPIFMENNLRSAMEFCDSNSYFTPITTNSLILKSSRKPVSTNLQNYYYGSSAFYAKEETIALFRIDNEKSRGYRWRRANELFVLLVFHPTDKPSPNFNINIYKDLTNSMIEKIPDRKLIAAIPFMPFGINDININLCKGVFKKLLNGTISQAYSFVNTVAVVHPDQTTNFVMLFDVKKFKQEYERGYKITDCVQKIILRLLLNNLFQKADHIKWNSPNPEVMRSVRPAPQPSNLNLKLYDYQLSALAWMMDIEKNILKRKYKFTRVIRGPGYPTLNILLHATEFYSIKNKRKFHEGFRIVTEDQINDPEKYPELFCNFTVRGGIFADEMGLGKTATMIALILSNPRVKNSAGEYLPEDRLPAVFESKSTLIICPNQLILQWKKEIETHCKEPLNVIAILTIKDLKAIRYQDILNSHAVIISHQFLKNANYLKSCGTLSTLLTRATANKSKISVTKKNPILQHIGWHRIVIDEGHEFLSSSDKAEGGEIFNSFLSNYRWYMTGTPVPRGRDSIVGLLNFLQISFDENIKLEERQTYRMIAFEYCLFAAVKENLFWKNTKETSKQKVIPDFTESIQLIRLTPHEQALYDAAKVANNVDDMRLICTQPKESSLMKAHGGNLKITEISSTMLAILKEKLTNYRKKIPIYKQKIEMSIKAEEEADLALKQLLKDEPPLPPGTTYWGYTPEYRLWKSNKERAEAALRNISNRIQTTRRKVFETENEIVTIVGQAACFSRVCEPSSHEICQLCEKNALNLDLTICDHSFCSLCILQFVRRNSRCPVCNTTLQIHDIYQPLHHPKSDASLISESSDDDDNNNNNHDHENGTQNIIEKKSADEKKYHKIFENNGTKISVIIKAISQILSEDPSHKIIVFSKWEDLLSTIGDILDEIYSDQNSIHISCKGNVTIKNKVINEFNSAEADAPRVLFLSLTRAASGTHLTVASHIILVDPPAGTKEEAIAYDSQAIARSHRMGQDKQVVVLRFIVENTIDQDDYRKAYGLS